MLKKLSFSALALLVGAATGHATDIEFWFGNTGSGETAILNACDAFNESQSEDHVTCVGQGGYETAMQKAIAAYRAGNAPALIQFFDAGTLDLMLSGAVEPVQQMAPDVDWSAYISGARSYYETSKGELFAQPYNGSTLIFYGNRALLAKAGIEELPSTFEEMVADARALKAAGVDCPYATDAHPWRVLEEFATRHNVPIASRNNGYDGLDAEYLINTGLIVEHMENLQEWREEGLVKLADDTAAGDYAVAFNTGECAMMESSTGSYGGAYSALGDDVMVGLAPMYEGYERHNTIIGGASIWIMKGHDDAERAAALHFLDFVRRPDQQLAMTATTGYLPMTRSGLDAIADKGLSDDPKFATAAVGIESLNAPAGENSRGLRLGFYMQFREIFKEETQKAFTGGQSMQTALDNAKSRGDALLRRFQQTYAGVTLP